MSENNPSEPTYEPDPFREEQKFEGGYTDTAFQSLFKTFSLYRQAVEREDDRRAADLAVDAKTIIFGIEDKDIQPPGDIARKYEFVKRFFMGGSYQDNARRRGHIVPRIGKTGYHRTHPYIVVSKSKGTVGSFRSEGAATMAARDLAMSERSSGSSDLIDVRAGKVTIKRFDTMGPVFEKRMTPPVPIERSSYESWRSIPPHRAQIRERMEMEENPPVENVWDRLTSRQKDHLLRYAGLSRDGAYIYSLTRWVNLPGDIQSRLLRHWESGYAANHPEYAENPWLIAGPTVAVRPDDKEIQPSDGGKGMIPAQTVSQSAERIVDAQTVQGKEEQKGIGLSTAEHKRRRKAAKKQRRTIGGRFKNNPMFDDNAVFSDNPGEEVPFDQVKVYEVHQRGRVFAGFFSYDPGRQVVTVKAVERDGNTERVVELDVLSDEAEARHMFVMLKKRGMGYFVKKVVKSGRVRGKRRYEHSVGQSQCPTPSHPTPYGPEQGYRHSYVPKERFKPVSSHFSEYDEKLKHAMTLSDQVRHEVGERDFSGALDALMRLHQLTVETQANRQSDLIGPISLHFQRSKAMVEGAWPGSVKFK